MPEVDAPAEHTCACCGRELRVRSYGDHGVARLRCCVVVYRDEHGKARRSGAYVYQGKEYWPLGKVVRVIPRKE